MVQRLRTLSPRPNAIALIIIASAIGLLDTAALRDLWQASGRELAFSLATTASVLFLGVLPGVLLAVLLSLLWFLSVNSRPHDAILGSAPGVGGFHDITDYPGAATVPGLLLYRFDANLVFFNCDYFTACVLYHLDAAPTPVEWVVIDASPISIIDYTAVKMLDDLRQELKSRGIVLASARTKQSLQRYFRADWVNNRGEALELHPFPTIKAAIDAFDHREQPQSR